MIPVGLCQCGCGATTTISVHSDSHHGYVRGQPRRFARGHRPRSRNALLEFMARVDVSGGDDACWAWTGDRVSHEGYGRFWTGTRTMLAHRASWSIFRWKIPGKLWVLHRCDNPICVNPGHLFLGTPLDNVRDMTAKGRRNQNPGERNANAKLTDAQALEIKRRATNGEAQRALAREFSVSPTTIYVIATGLGWKHIGAAFREGCAEVASEAKCAT